MTTAVLETERLSLFRLSERSPEDCAFTLRQLNEPSFLRNIGDRGVRTLEQARDYVFSRMVSSYRSHGYGLYGVRLKTTGQTIGSCGLIRRDALDAPDLGYALLPEFESCGYASEAAAGVLAHARTTLGLHRILAITDPANAGSIRVLEKLGFRFEKMVRLPAEDIDLKLFVSDVAES
ncbi:GNAT family N-acetyltransferase [Pseudoxanthomonas wuyuanensis]|jgi:[ribosomal protein S5]-alanine N-acetyltransferase|uniref:Protein N-acetyltransferase, RimJ/RimL family n=1 Tax=Pseudoxanthomonas wuyuanensis TaxID=1073196 RepID=A0A286CV76_9GAMM|nr:GNAT family N-acetyltransferase [Pseudoxanthomonas wuyuanensis]KAF1721359.1 N-acetyltransferase [Pseudoxanthomonas wuyuanensis]SOD50309.1 Protein N-acetyltransferase, RimJ/RimL family [Pseudoxanthomonas wuyuanensis]